MGSTESYCEHYQRKCLLVAPCCDKEYQCRLCHDDVENHNLVRKNVESLVCSQCNLKQEVSKNCTSCGILFGTYSCLHCRLFDDTDKQQFHCEGCGICRVGGRDNFHHCSICNMCISVSIKDSHKCLGDVSKKNCPVCLEFLHTSRKSIHVPKCSHMMHWDCYREMLSHGSYTCPVCNRSLENMSSYWNTLDNEVANTIMPAIYREYQVNILCRDCQQESKVHFHVIGLKCQHCGGYNTTRIGGDEPIPTDPLNTLQELVTELEQTDVEAEDEEGWETASEGDEHEADDDENEADDSKKEEENQDSNTNNTNAEPSVS